MLPNCHNAEIARELVGLCKYEPDGNRGISIMRGHCGYNAVDDPEEFMRRKNEETIVIVQIESRDGLKNVGEIAAVPGVDIALIGPNDLSHSLGIMGQYHNPEFIRATEDVAAACKKAGKWAAIQATNPAAMREYMERGFDFILYGNEVSLLMSAARQENLLRRLTAAESRDQSCAVASAQLFRLFSRRRGGFRRARSRRTRRFCGCPARREKRAKKPEEI